MPPLDKENLPPRRYTDNCHHNFMVFSQQKCCSEINSRSRSELCQASKGQQKLYGFGSSKNERERKLCSLEISVPNCLCFTTPSGRGERGEKKKQKTQKK